MLATRCRNLISLAGGSTVRDEIISALRVDRAINPRSISWNSKEN